MYVCGGDDINGTKMETAPETLNDLSSLHNYLHMYICSYESAKYIHTQPMV